MRLIPFATAILTVFLSCYAQGAPDTGQRPYKIGLWPAIVFKGDKSWTLDERMRHYGVPGVSIALIKDFKVGWVRNYGLADRRTGEPVTRNTLFQAGSISKPVAAFAALQMVEAGQLDLDADVNATLKAWKLPDNEFTADNKVTLRHLLSHTGGLTVHGFWGYPPDQPAPTLVQVLDGTGPANSEPVRVDKPPGEGFRYSGGGYSIAQQMMIDASGKPFPELMQELLLGPADMNQSTFTQPLPADWLKHAAAGVLPQGFDVPGKRHTYPEMAAAGLWTTAGDLARFVVELQSALQGVSELMSRDMAWLMVSPVDSGYALGLSVREQGGMGYFGHGGWDEGFSAEMVGSFEGGYGVVVMTNSNHPDFIKEVIRGVGFAYGWSGYDVREKLDIPREVLENAPGRYRYDATTAINVYTEGDRLFMRYTGELPQEMFFVGDNLFLRRTRETPVKFTGAGEERTLNYIVSSDDQPPRKVLTTDEILPGEVLEKSGFDEAVAAFRAALQANPHEQALSEYWINSSGLGKLVENIEFATALLRINTLLYPDSAHTWDSLGKAYQVAGQKNKAIESYKAALQRDPDLYSARMALKELTG